MCSKYVSLECISVIYDPDDTVVCNNECQKQQEELNNFFFMKLTMTESSSFASEVLIHLRCSLDQYSNQRHYYLYLQNQQISCF